MDAPVSSHTPVRRRPSRVAVTPLPPSSRQDSRRWNARSRRGRWHDTRGLFAAARLSTDRHAEVAAAYRNLLSGTEPLITTDLIVAEHHALSIARVHPRFGLELVERPLASGRIETVVAGIDRITAASDLLQDRPGRAYSLTDAISFVLMRELSIPRAFTLDADFAAEGFAVLP